MICLQLGSPPPGRISGHRTQIFPRVAVVFCGDIKAVFLVEIGGCGRGYRHEIKCRASFLKGKLRQAVRQNFSSKVPRGLPCPPLQRIPFFRLGLFGFIVSVYLADSLKRLQRISNPNVECASRNFDLFQYRVRLSIDAKDYPHCFVKLQTVSNITQICLLIVLSSMIPCLAVRQASNKAEALTQRGAGRRARNVSELHAWLPFPVRFMSHLASAYGQPVGSAFPKLSHVVVASEARTQVVML